MHHSELIMLVGESQPANHDKLQQEDRCVLKNMANRLVIWLVYVWVADSPSELLPYAICLYILYEAPVSRS